MSQRCKKVAQWVMCNGCHSSACAVQCDCIMFQLDSLQLFPLFREAARECRRKKKEYVKCLENRVAVLENQNKTLIEELKTLKDLYCVKTG